MHVAIDIGGTFTDAVAIDDYGIIKTAKSSTTHENLTIGAINSLKALKIILTKFHLSFMEQLLV